MYESSFQLDRRPFMAAPQLDSYFPAPSIEAARQTLASCIQRGAGPGLLIGPAGTGKSLLCHKLASQFQSRAEVVVLSKTHLCTRRALLQLILFELGLPYRGLDEGEVRLSLIDYLTSSDRDPSGLVLLVDEAHCLRFKLLEEIRMLSNLVHDGQSCVHVVLAGNAVLEERFASPKLEAFNQRVVARAYLRPLNREETLGYIQSQVASAGGNAMDLFTDKAFDAVYQAAGGVPRLINQICEHALVLAAAGGFPKLDAAGIEAAWADLQQLPAPASARATSATSSQTGVVEFGSLDDELFEDEHPKQGWLDQAHSAAPDPPYSCAKPDEEAPPPGVRPHPRDHGAERRLEEIQQQVEQVNREWDELPAAIGDGPDSPEMGPPAWESVNEAPPPVAYDPFSEPFDEEEVVLVDRYTLTELPAPLWQASPPCGLQPASPSGQASLSQSIQDACQQTQARDEATALDDYDFGAQSLIVDDLQSPTDNPEELVSDYLILPPASLDDHAAEDDREQLAGPAAEQLPGTCRKECGDRCHECVSPPDGRALIDGHLSELPLLASSAPQAAATVEIPVPSGAEEDSAATTRSTELAVAVTESASQSSGGRSQFHRLFANMRRR